MMRSFLFSTRHSNLLPQTVQPKGVSLLSVYQFLLVISIGLCFWKSVVIKWNIVRRMTADNYATNFENADILRLADRLKNDLFRVATVGVSNSSAYSGPHRNFYPNYAGVYGFEATGGYSSMYSKRYEDFWGEVIRPLRLIDNDVDKRWKIKPIWIYLYAPFDGRLNQQEAFNFSDYYSLNLLSLANTKYLISRWQLIHPDLKLVSAPTEALEQKREWNKRSRLGKYLGYLKGDYPPRALYIYENTSVLARAFLVGQVRVFRTSEALLDTLKDTPVTEMRKTAFLESADASAILDRPLGFSQSEVEILDYTPDRIAVSVEADGPGILVMTNNYSPFWKVWVDDVQGMIVPTYHTFQSVYLKAGQRKVVFEYDPPYKLF